MRRDGCSRREFLAVAGAAPISASLVSGMAAEAKQEEKAPSASGKLKFSCMVTLEDWTYGSGIWSSLLALNQP